MSSSSDSEPHGAGKGKGKEQQHQDGNSSDDGSGDEIEKSMKRIMRGANYSRYNYDKKDEKKKKKKKEKYIGGGGGGVGLSVAEYVSFKNNGNGSSQEKERSGKGGKPAMLWEDEKDAVEVLRDIGKDRNWDESEISSDALILARNRLKQVRDLRSLSKHSWDQIELLPLVKDLLREAVSKKADGSLLLKYERRAMNSTAEDGGADDHAGRFLLGVEGKDYVRRKSTDPLPPGKCRVFSDDGKVYEIDKLCPHKGADLSKGIICNGVLSCPKHHWKFDLKNGGKCLAKGVTINAKCIVNDW
eukprot:Nk52_evm71s1073 gene=Nk52_evmTU71s1073